MFPEADDEPAGLAEGGVGGALRETAATDWPGLSTRSRTVWYALEPAMPIASRTTATWTT